VTSSSRPPVAEELRRSAAHLFVTDLADAVLDEESRHHVRVLRIGDAETVTLTDGQGRWSTARVRGGDLVEVSEPITQPEPEAPFTLMVAVPKQSRPELIVQKATELGVDHIVWLQTERSVVRWDAERAERQRQRLDRIALEASLQCRRVHLPTISGPVAAHEVLAGAALAEPGGRALRAADRVVAVGPEGGWTPEELAVAESTVSLGPLVMRVETAAIAACALAAVL